MDDYPLGIGIFGFVGLVVRDAVVVTTFETNKDDENIFASHQSNFGVDL